MRLSTLVFLVMLAATASCATFEATSQTSQPIAPVAPVSDTPVPSVGSTVFSSTAIASCICLNGTDATPVEQGSAANVPPVVCNCPAIILPTATETAEGTPTAGTPGQEIVTLQDNRKTITMQAGDRFLLDLGIGYDWTVNVDNQSVLSRVVNVAVIQGAQGIYEAHKSGQAILTSTGDPPCRKTVPACAMPSIFFQLTVIVQ